MRSVKDVEAYLGRLGRRFRPVDDNGEPTATAHTFLVHSSESMPPIAVRVDPPLVVLRVHIGDIDGGDERTLFRKLLELNAESLVHTSYGLEGNRIVLTCALALENLDFNELEATLDEIDLVLAEQVPVLAGISRGDSLPAGTPSHDPLSG